jgi:hypothetical protein
VAAHVAWLVVQSLDGTLGARLVRAVDLLELDGRVDHRRA